MPTQHLFAGAVVGLTVLTAAPALAYPINDNAEVYGYAQLWFTAWEQMGSARGVYQYPSHDEAADAATGFSLNRAQIGLRIADPDWHLSLRSLVQLDHSPNLLDAELAWAPWTWFSLHFGQFRVPGTYEALILDRDLDLIVRADITTALADYSLSKSENTTSILYGSASQLRDLGIAAKGDFGDGRLGARYFLMVGNGLGANMYFGGLTHKEYFITNHAQFYYGARLELLALNAVTLGMFGSYNRHDNILFNSGRLVYDINRRMIGGDLRVIVPNSGLSLSALGGGGQIRDNFTGDGKIDLQYDGWAIATVLDLAPALAHFLDWTLPAGHGIELAYRFDRYESQANQSGITVRADHSTLGLSYVGGVLFQVRANYIIRHTYNPTMPEFANNVLLIKTQIAF